MSVPTQYEGRDLEAMSFAKNYRRWIVSIFEPYLGKRVAEIGAGSGSFSLLLLSQKIEQLVCVEPSLEMYPLLVRKCAGDSRVILHQALFASVDEKYPEYFDSIMYINVLEHIENDVGELQHVARSLKVGGHVCIFVPALPWLYSDLDASVGHYRRYYKGRLAQLVRAAGFEIVQISYFDIIGIIPWFVFFKMFHKRLSASDTLLYDRLVVPLMRILESVFPVPIGKNLIVIAKRV